MSDSTNLQLPYLEGAQAQKHVTVNESLRRLDAFVFLAVEDKDLTAPPGSPADGARYLPAITATGGWSGKENHVAHYVDGAWEFYTPREGWQAYVKDEDTLYCYSGSAWISILTAGLDSDLQTIAALTPSNNDVVQRKSGVWTNRTPAQLAADLAAAMPDGVVAVPGLAFTADPDTGLWRPGANVIAASVGASEAWRATASLFSLPSCVSLGANGSATGTLLMKGTTSGTVTLQSQAAAGTWNFNLPTSAGSAGDVLTSQGGGSSAMTWTTPGGSGVSSLTGTSNQIAASASTGAVTLSLPTNPVLPGFATSNAFVPSTSSVPSNGMYLPASNTLGWATNSAVQMRLDSSGFLGIGTAPGVKLDCLENIDGNSVMRFKNASTGTSATAGIYFIAGTTQAAFELSGDSTTAGGRTAQTFSIGNPGSGGLQFAASHASGAIKLATAGATALTINAAHEVLIGATDQGAYLLQVNSQIWATSATIATSDLTLKDVLPPPSRDLLAEIGAIPALIYSRKDRPQDGIRAGYGAQHCLAALERHGLGARGIVQRNKTGLLSLDEGAVHTLKIAALEQRIDRLERAA